jgi:hypothetical protein
LATGEYEIGLCIETRLKQSQRWNDWKKGWEGAKHLAIRERTQTMIKRADSMLNPFFSFVDDNRIGRLGRTLCVVTQPLRDVAG